MKTYVKAIFWILISILLLLLYVDFLRGTKLQDEVMFRTVLASDYVLANARDSVASSTGNLEGTFGSEGELSGKSVTANIQQAFTEYIDNTYGMGQYTKVCTTEQPTPTQTIMTCELTPTGDFLPTLRERILHGKLTVRLAIVELPQGDRSIYGIGISTRQSLVSLLNFGFYAKKGVNVNNESDLWHLVMRSDRVSYLVSSY